MELASLAIAIVSAIFSTITYCVTVRYEKRKITIEAINLLQNEVLDKFVTIEEKNAQIIVETLDNEKCREAYDGYRALIARLEHFSIGVKKKIYDFGIVNDLVGVHFICLYKKIKPIIDRTNMHEKQACHYCFFLELVKKLDDKKKILNKGECK